MSAGSDPVAIGLEFYTQPFIVYSQIAVSALSHRLRSHALYFLREHSNIGSVMPVVAEVIESVAVLKTPKKYDIVLQSDVRSPAASTAIPAPDCAAACITCSRITRAPNPSTIRRRAKPRPVDASTVSAPAIIDAASIIAASVIRGAISGAPADVVSVGIIAGRAISSRPGDRGCADARPVSIAVAPVSAIPVSPVAASISHSSDSSGSEPRATHPRCADPGAATAAPTLRPRIARRRSQSQHTDEADQDRL